MEEALYKLELDCGYTSLFGLFIENTNYIDYLINNKIKVNFGEVSGKHSEVYVTITENDITKVTDKEDVLEMVEDEKLQFGYDPLDQRVSYEVVEKFMTPEEAERCSNPTVREFVKQMIQIDYYLKDLKYKVRFLLSCEERLRNLSKNSNNPELKKFLDDTPWKKDLDEFNLIVNGKNKITAEERSNITKDLRRIKDSLNDRLCREKP